MNGATGSLLSSMSQSPGDLHRQWQRLSLLLKLNIAFEEACLAELAKALTQNGLGLTSKRRHDLRDRIRHHRVEIIQTRALMGSIGIDV